MCLCVCVCLVVVVVATLWQAKLTHLVEDGIVSCDTGTLLLIVGFSVEETQELRL